MTTPWATSWREVDDADVFNTAYVISEAAWRSLFAEALEAAGPWPVIEVGVAGNEPK